MRVRSLALAVSALSLFLLVSACGGGGGGGGSPPSIAPAHVLLTPGIGRLGVSWDAVGGAAEYNVYLSSAPGVTNLNYGIMPDGAHAPSYSGTSVEFEGLIQGKTYYVVVTAQNGAGEGPYSPEVSSPLIPDAPSAPAFMSGITCVDITWTGSLGATAYDLYVATDPSINSSNWASVSNGRRFLDAVPPYLLDGLVNGTTYYAVVVAKNAAGLSHDSNVGSGAPSGRGTFVGLADIPAGSGPLGTVSALLNGDATLDIAVVSQVDAQVLVFFGAGDGLFTPGPVLDVGASPGSIITADVNADGALDLVTTNFADATVTVWLGDGAGGFFARFDSPTGGSPWAAVAASVNPLVDSTLDLVVTDTLDNSLAVLLGNGDGTFQAPVLVPTGPSPTLLLASDVNGDTYPELLVANSGDGTVTTVVGDGMGGVLNTVTSAAVASPSAMTAGLLDGDTNVDLAITSSTDGSVTVLHGVGDGSFLLGTSIVTGGSATSVVDADFNGDGKPDLAVANADTGTVTVLLGDGGGLFSVFYEMDTGAGPVDIVVGDYNHDGVLDLIVTSQVDGTVQVFLGSPV